MIISSRDSSSRIPMSFVSIILCVAIIAALIPHIPYNINKDNNSVANTSQTKYANITEFQNARWTEIQNAVFDKDYTSVQEPDVIKDLTVKEGNPYFNWTDTSNMQGYDEDGNTIDGGLKKFNTEYYNQNFDDSDLNASLDKFKIQHMSLGTQNYKGSYKDWTGKQQTVTSSIGMEKYDVYTPEQFVFMLYMVASINDFNYSKSKMCKINICADLDMGGALDQIYPNNNIILDSKHLYIEGNGHTVYNLKMYSTQQYMGLYQKITGSTSQVIVNNIGFQSVVLLHDSDKIGRGAGLFYGYAGEMDRKGMSMSNVHLNMAYYQQRVTGDFEDNSIAFGLLGGKASARVFFVNNCTTSNAVMYGTNHISGTFSYLLGNASGSMNSSVKYDADFPENPEVFVIENVSSSRYPMMFYNSSSTDCEIFSVGYDSGAFISCGTSVIYRNCYTNNTIYGTSNTGTFIGRSDAIPSYGSGRELPMIKDDNGESTIANVFINCYSSGAVEGKVAIGGFVGLDNGYRSNLDIEEGRTGSSDCNGTLYMNCYSTAMVGMDYSGKYVGGFVGLDDNYSKNVAEVTAPDGEKIKAKGSIYVNCYAAGEVGNILTHTDTQKSIDSDGIFFDDNYHISKNNMDNGYMPTGGFIGAINIDNYYKSTKKAFSSLYDYIKRYAYGYFYNCYYDMQTTGMHEMAIGQAYAETYRDDNGNRYAINPTDTPLRTVPFSVEGIRGIYTEKSDVKKIAGMTGQPSEYKDGDKTLSRMSMDSENALNTDSSVWQYNEGYYPQLKVFMTSDSTVTDLKKATAEDITEKIKKSVFYIGDNAEQKNESGQITKCKTTPVLSLANDFSNVYDADYKPNTNKYASQLTGVMTAYRYSQASTSTVFLNHWDYTMDTNSGNIGAENDWVVGLPNNAMTKTTTSDGKTEWTKTFENLQAGTYDFKVQANTSWAYNYGANGFNGNQNIQLRVNEGESKVVIRFGYGGLKSEQYYVYADVYGSDGNLIRTDTLAYSEGNVYKETPYTVAGSFDISWEASSEKGYKMTCKSNDGTNGIYEYTFKNLAAGEYNFKITDGNGWTNNWGKDGKADGNNMSFSVDSACDVTITFNEETKHCSVSGASISNVECETKAIPFDGYSVIFSSDIFNGYQWLPAGSELEVAKAGEMTLNEETGLYEKTITLTNSDLITEKNYAYKVIKNAVDSGENKYFYLKDFSEASISIKILYDEKTGEFWIEKNNYIGEPNVSSYVVAGTKALTGYDWLNDEGAATAGIMSTVAGTKKYSKTYKNIKAGTYSFKVFGDGSLTTGISWGNSTTADGNYNITLTDTCDVTIYFDTSTYRISVDADYLKKDEYVLSGTGNLMSGITDASTGKAVGSWNKTAPKMIYHEDTGKYTYDISDVPANKQDIIPDGTTPINSNYAFKVIPYNNDQGDNIIFALYGNEEKYNLHFEYDPYTKKTSVSVKDSDGNDVTDSVYNDNIDISFYSVIGDESLTGDNWGGTNPPLAALNGKMIYNTETGLYEKTYDIKVPTDGNVIPYAFKIVANGTWDSGISYGGDDGGNLVVSVASADETVNKAKLTITFNEKNGEITTTTDPDVMKEITDENFIWYVTGTYLLRSNNGYKYDAKVYDTVRDITSMFKFTSEQGMDWLKNKQKNMDSGFFDENSFDLDYSVDGKDISGTFRGSVVSLKYKEINEAGTQIKQYYVEDFMPGKQWLTVTSGRGKDSNLIYGSRNLRLIPSAYLEAGNDAKINVFESSDGGQNTNVVKYSADNDNEQVSFSDTLNNRGFSYYNFALTAGYCITDKIGLGVYSNYNGREVKSYSLSDLRDDDKSADIKENTYFGMSSAFNNSVNENAVASYSDGGNRNGANLAVGEFRNESIIGSSKKITEQNADGTETVKQIAKTIVKVFRRETNYGKETLTLINMDSTEGAKGTYHDNYLKWTGQKDFTANDAGNYIVSFYWTLSDGRYLTDSKEVGIVTLQPSLYKEVNIDCTSTTDSDKIIEYTLTYRNDSTYENLNFAILDILPFDGSKRELNGKVTKYDNNSWKLKSVQVTTDSSAVIKGLYYSSNSDEIRSIDASKEDVAKDIIKNDGTINTSLPITKYFTSLSYKSGVQTLDIDNVTALLLTGGNLGIGESVTMVFKLEYNPSVSDLYVNNAHFCICSSDASDVEFQLSGACQPVETAVVSRNLSGYAWLDSNRNSIYDDGEYAILGVKAVLCDIKGEAIKNTDDTPKYTAMTDKNGMYEFKNIPAGNYMVKFTAPEGGKITVGNKAYDFSKLKVSETKREIERKNMPLNSSNISSGSYDKTTKELDYAFCRVEMPSNSNIYYGRWTVKRNMILDGYNYTKTLKNVAFYDENNDIPYDYSMYVNKVNESDEALSNVEFMLEFKYISGDSEIWYPVYFVTEDDGTRHMFYDIKNGMSGQMTETQIIEYNKNHQSDPIQYIFKTDANGHIDWQNLIAGEYRLVEMNTAPGYNKLISPFYFNLPYKITLNLDESGNPIDNDNNCVAVDNENLINEVFSEDGKKKTYSYKKVGFKVVNNKQLNLPQTGGRNQWFVTTVGVVIFGMCAGFFYRSKKRKNKGNSK